jgi:hypothetical protein
MSKRQSNGGVGGGSNSLERTQNAPQTKPNNKNNNKPNPYLNTQTYRPHSSKEHQTSSNITHSQSNLNQNSYNCTHINLPDTSENERSKRKAISPESTENSQTQNSTAKFSKVDPSIKFAFSSTESDASELDDQLMDEEIPADDTAATQTRAESSPANENLENRLPSIKLRISRLVIDHYKNPLNLADEINRCKPSDKVDIKIKFAYVNYNKSMVVVVTDDKATHDSLLEKWPEDAFGKGAIVINQIRAKQDEAPIEFKLIIKNVHSDIDIESDRVINQLRKQGLTNAIRKVSRNNGKPQLTI